MSLTVEMIVARHRGARVMRYRRYSWWTILVVAVGLSTPVMTRTICPPWCTVPVHVGMVIDVQVTLRVGQRVYGGSRIFEQQL